MAVNTLLQVRRGTSTLWSSVDPTLNAGEFGYETNTGYIKVGDGTTNWSSLPYFRPYDDDFKTAISGLFPYVTGANGVAVSWSAADNQYTVELSDPTIQSTDITDFIDAVNDRVGNLLTEGENIQLTYTDNDDATSTLQISVTGLNSADISDFNTAVDARVTAASISAEQVMDIVSTGVIAGTGIFLSYDTNAFDGQITIDTSGLAYNDHNHTLSDITDVTASAAEVNVLDDVVAGTVSAGDAVVVNSSKDIGDFRYVTASMFLGNTSGNLTGNADTSTESTNVTVTANDTADETVYLTFVDGATGAQGIETDTNLYYNPNSDTLSVGNVITTSNITIGGNLVVNGTTTTVNSTTVDIGDNIIQVNVSGSEVLGGIQVYDHDNSETHKLVWDIEDSRWEFIGDTSPDVYTSGNITATYFYGDGSNLTNLDYNNISSNLPDPIITGELTGDITGIANATFTDLGNTHLTINTTLGNNVVESSNILDGTILNQDISDSAGIGIHKLSASGITLGDTEYFLGDSTTALSGMTQLAGTSSASPMYIYWAVMDGGSP